MGQLRESRWVELNLVGSMGDACLLKSLPFGGAHPDHPATPQFPEVFVYNVDAGRGVGARAHYQALHYKVKTRV